MQQQDRQSRYYEQPPGLEARNPLQLPSIVESGMSEGPGGPNAALPTNPDPSTMPTVAEHSFSSVSPAGFSPMSSDYFRTSQSSSMGTLVDQLSPAMMHNPRRAYRQRRKDPSCDACRERKVKVEQRSTIRYPANAAKCDATETTSCTECSSRNVRCQFTKDTNRRMSSIK